jgi:uncharacterized protein
MQQHLAWRLPTCPDHCCHTHARTHAQSFDCTKASTTIEAAICGDKSLGELDNTLARTFREALSRAPDQQGKLIRDERRWLAHREQVCAQPVNGSSGSLIACLTNVYMVRINQLSPIRADTPLTIPQACAVVRDYNDAKLENASTPTPPDYVIRTSPWYSSGTPPPPAEFTPHLVPYDPDGDPPGITVSEGLIDGKRASFVAVTSSHDCSAVTNYEVWSTDLKQYRGSIADALQREPTDGDRPQLVSIKGQGILLNAGSQGGDTEIDVLGFKHNLAPVLACRVALEPRHPEKTLSAVDAELCAAVLHGDVEEVALSDLSEQPLQLIDLGALPSGFEFIRDVEIFARGVVDIAHEGHPQTIAMIRSTGLGGAGCGFGNLAWEWPVVFTGHDRPDPSSPINQEAVKAGSQVSRLIQFRGRIYVDGHSLPEEHGKHTVVALSKGGIQKMCEFEPFHYVVKLPQAQ